MVSPRAFFLLTAQFPPPTLFSMHLCLPLSKINIPQFGGSCLFSYTSHLLPLKRVAHVTKSSRSPEALNFYKYCQSTRLAWRREPPQHHRLNPEQQHFQDTREPHTNSSSKANSQDARGWFWPQNPLQPTELKSSSTKRRNEPHIKSGFDVRFTSNIS